MMRTCLFHAVRCWPRLQWANHAVNRGSRQKRLCSFILHNTRSSTGAAALNFPCEVFGPIRPPLSMFQTAASTRRLFFSACASPNADMVRKLVAQGVSANTVFDSGKTPLLYAVQHMDTSLVEFLLQHGAVINGASSGGWSPLNLALYEAASNEKPETVELLMKMIPMLHTAGFVYDPNDARGARALVCFGSLKLLHWFFAQGANPLTVPELVRYLKENDVDLDATDNAGKTRLHKAVEHGSLEAARALIQVGVDVNSGTRHGPPLLLAATRGDVEMVRLLLSANANPTLPNRLTGATPLLSAISAGNLVVAMLLLQAGASLDERDEQGTGVLHKAISSWNKDPTIFSVLISLGADIHVSDSNSADAMPLLHYAARCGCVGAIEELLRCGFAVDTRSPSTSVTALHVACMLGRVEAARVLLAHGANPTLGDNGGVTPLSSAVRQNEVGIVRLFASLRCSISANNTRGETPLHYAANGGNQEIVELLVQAGGDVHAKDNDGWTPLHFAAQAQGTGVVTYLIEQGADVNAQDNGGRTPLVIAVSFSRTEIVNVLLSEGAATQLRTRSGLTALEVAKSHSLTQCERLLETAEWLECIP